MTDKRRLAAVMFSDICGYTKLMGEDEAHALEVLSQNRDFHRAEITAHGGHFVKEIGDGNMAWFDSSKQAVECALAILTSATAHGYDLRFGVHEGDTVIRGGDIFGSGVNIAARVEAAAIPGSILVSEKVADSLKNQPHLRTKSIGTYQLKNDHKPRAIHALTVHPCEIPKPSEVRARPIQPMVINLRVVAMIIAVIVAAGMLWLGMRKSSGTDTGINGEEIVLAIMPFESPSVTGAISPDALAAGLTERLSLVPGVVTIAAQQARKQGQLIEQASVLGGIKLGEIAARMQATHFVEGALDENLHVELKLTEGENAIWKGKFSMDTPMETVNNISNAIVRELGLATSAPVHDTDRPFGDEASTLYLEALYLWHERSSKDKIVRAIDLLEEADLLEPNYPDVLGLLAMCWATGTERNYFDFDTSQFEIFDYAERTLNLDPDHPFGLLALGTYYFKMDDFALAQNYYTRAFDRGPDRGITSQALGELSLYTGRHRAALDYIKRAQKAAPRDLTVLQHLAYTEMANGFPKASKKISDDLVVQFDTLAERVYYKVFDRLIYRDFDGALQVIHDHIGQKRSGMSYLAEGIVYVEKGDSDLYWSYMQTIDTSSYVGQHVHILWLAHNEGESGAQRAADMYGEMMARDGFSLTYPLQTYPLECFNSFRTNPEIQKIAREYGIEFSEHPYFKMKSEFKD